MYRLVYSQDDPDETHPTPPLPAKPPTPAQVASTRWEQIVQAIATNRDPRVRESLYLGTHNLDGSPVLIHRSQIAFHGLFLGGTGSAKTTLGIMPLLCQLARQKDWNSYARRWDLHAAIVIVDLKGDPALLVTAWLEALRSNRTFKLFTNELGKATHTYPALAGSAASADISWTQIAESLLDALGLQHGEGYGRSYYSRRALEFLLRHLRTGSVRSFEDLDRLCASVQDKKEREDTYEVLCIIKMLSSVPQLNVTTRNSIDIGEALRERQILYFWLPAPKESQTVREIAKLVCYEVFQQVRPETPVYLFIDEFARCASSMFTIMLEQGRSLGLSMLLSCQGLNGLKTHDVDLRDAVWTNCHYKQIFSIGDPDTKHYVDRALGQMTVLQKSSTLSIQVPLLATPGDYSEINADLYLSLLSVTRDSDLTQLRGLPVPLRMEHSLSRDEYDRRSKALWPSAQQMPGGIIATRDGYCLTDDPTRLIVSGTTSPSGASRTARPRLTSPVGASADAPAPEASSRFTEGLHKLLEETAQAPLPRKASARNVKKQQRAKGGDASHGNS